MSEKILLVDDDPDTTHLVGLMLERQGYETLVAKDGIQALGMAESKAPDLILLDVMMPDLDGYEVTRRLRASPATTEIPIILFTARNDVDDKVSGYEAGADAYLTKPIQPRELIAHMKAILARSSKARALTAVQKRGHMVGVLAVKGGLGTSTLALNLGVALAADRAQKDRVIVAEFRPGQGTFGLELGLVNCDGLNRLLHRNPAEITRRDVEAELAAHSSGVRLLLASHQPRDARHSTLSANFDAVARQLPLLGNFIILDLGTALTPVTEKLLTQLDEVLVVVEPTQQNVIQSRALIEDLFANGIGEARLEVVMVNRVRSGLQLSLAQMQGQLGCNIPVFITPVPELAFQATNQKVPLILQQPDSLTAQQFATLAERVVQRKR